MVNFWAGPIRILKIKDPVRTAVQSKTWKLPGLAETGPESKIYDIVICKQCGFFDIFRKINKFDLSCLDSFGRNLGLIFIKTYFSIRLGFNHRSVNEFWWFFSGASGQNSTAGWWSSKTTRNRYLSPTAENTASTVWSILFLNLGPF